jgi:hypothetical protein
MTIKIKKQCAISNCNNPKCPFPHAKPTDKKAKESPAKPKEHMKPLPLFNYSIPGIAYNDLSLLIVAPSVEVSETAPVSNASPLYEYVGVEHRRCKHCGGHFKMDAAELNWYVEKGLHLPKRCKVCRAVQRYGQRG